MRFIMEIKLSNIWQFSNQILFFSCILKTQLQWLELINDKIIFTHLLHRLWNSLYNSMHYSYGIIYMYWGEKDYFPLCLEPRKIKVVDSSLFLNLTSAVVYFLMLVIRIIQVMSKIFQWSFSFNFQVFLLFQISFFSFHFPHYLFLCYIWGRNIES